jgi:hypothetical protein
MAIGDQKEQNRYQELVKNLEKFYHENTSSLVAYIEKINGKKGGE